MAFLSCVLHKSRNPKISCVACHNPSQIDVTQSLRSIWAVITQGLKLGQTLKFMKIIDEKWRSQIQSKLNGENLCIPTWNFSSNYVTRLFSRSERDSYLHQLGQNRTDDSFIWIVYVFNANCSGSRSDFRWGNWLIFSVNFLKISG